MTTQQIAERWGGRAFVLIHGESPGQITSNDASAGRPRL
jgi:hypothetical protein